MCVCVRTILGISTRILENGDIVLFDTGQSAYTLHFPHFSSLKLTRISLFLSLPPYNPPANVTLKDAVINTH